MDTTLVLIPVTVTDPMNRFVTGLEREHFRLFEDKNEQNLVQFSSEDAPLSVGVVFDTSGSMGNKLEKIAAGGGPVLEDRQPRGRVLPGAVQRRPELTMAASPTTLEEIQNRLTFTQSKGRTALLDAHLPRAPRR